MNLAFLLQKQADAKAKARAIHTKATNEGRITTAEEDEQFKAYMAEASSYDVKIADARSLLEAERTAPAVPAAGAVAGAIVGHNNNEDKPWATLAEQARAVKAAALTPQRTDVRLLAAAAGASESIDGDGGFLVAAEFSKEIVKRTFGKAQVASRCRAIPMGSNRIVFPRANDASRVDGQRNGGIQAFWTYEAAQYTKSKPTFGQLALQVDKLTALCVGTDELLEDTAGAWKAYVDEGVSDELSFKVDDAIFNGPGVSGGPLGINNSSAIIVIAEESSQTAATVVYPNLKKMYARMPGYLRAGAAWFVNQDTEPQLWDITRGSGTAVELVYTPPGSRNNQSSMGSMFNLPVIPIEQAATLGTQGDITLGNFNEYMLGQRGGVQADASIHFYFDTGQQLFRWTLRIAGESMWDKPVTPKNGTNTQSPFIQLATRS